MGRAGIVLGLEVSRLARNNADWHRLLEICAMSGTLICDEDGLYDPTDFNDRLLLGLKGTMSEAELHFIRARLLGGQLSKARRGELQMPLPVGLVYDPAGKVVLDPDTGVQQAIRHVFTLFARTGSARATVQQFNADGLLFPVRVRTGARKGELAWMPLQHWRVLRTLHNPRYAGAFAYGRRRERLAGNGKKTFETLPREQWIALIPDAHPGYISWDQYETNQKLLLANATAHGDDRAAGPAREGPALLQGLAICGRCGRRMTVRYHTRRGVEVPDYQCMNRCIQDGAATLPNHPRRGRRRRRRHPAARHPHPARARGRPDRAGRTRHPRRRGRRAAPPSTSNAPATAPTWPAAATWPSTRTTGWSPTASKPTGTTRCAPCRPRARTTTAPAPPPQPPSPTSSRTESVPWQPISPPSGPTRTPRSGTANAWSACWSTTSPCTRPTASTCTSASAAGRPPASPSRSRPQAWQVRQTHPDTLAALDRLLDTHTDAETADALNAAGHRSGEGKPFTARIVLARTPQATICPATPSGSAPNGLLTTTELAATPRRAPQHRQELDQGRNPQLPQGKRQE